MKKPPLDLTPIKQALHDLATLDDPDQVMPFVDYCDDLIKEVERLRRKNDTLRNAWETSEKDRRAAIEKTKRRKA